LAKQVQAKAVIQAMERVRSRHAFAWERVNAITKDSAQKNRLATILAGSMAAGINHKDADRIMQALQERTRNMTRAEAEDLALQTVMSTRTMARLGMHSQAVGDSVCQALQQGYSAQEMQRMRNTVMANSRHSFSENSSKGHRSDAAQHGGQGGHGGDHGGGMGGGNGGGSGGMGGGRR
jgi:hypothetical protein